MRLWTELVWSKVDCSDAGTECVGPHKRLENFLKSRATVTTQKWFRSIEIMFLFFKNDVF